MTEIKLCPFCNTNDVDMDFDPLTPRVEKYQNSYFVSCRVCDFEGPYFFGPEEAIQHWNKRPREPESLV